MEKFNCMVLDWNEIVNTTKKTSAKIKQSNFHPDVIIGISRGGLVPARLFCDFLHVKSCFSLKVDHWGLTATKNGEAKLTQPLNMDLTGLNVLLVDDITDTGQSLELAKNHLQEKNPKSLKTATMYHLLTGSDYKPDFYGEERKWSWMVFPWNYMEDLVNILKKITNNLGKTHDEIKEELKENFNIIINKNKIKEVLYHIDYLDNLKK